MTFRMTFKHVRFCLWYSCSINFSQSLPFFHSIYLCSLSQIFFSQLARSTFSALYKCIFFNSVFIKLSEPKILCLLKCSCLHLHLHKIFGFRKRTLTEKTYKDTTSQLLKIKQRKLPPPVWLQRASREVTKIIQYQILFSVNRTNRQIMNINC